MDFPSSGSSRYFRLKDILTRASALPGSARAAFLAECCQGDEELRREAESLLAHDAGFPALDAMALAGVADEEGAPETIGPYRVKRALGEGGMGVVYHAEQSEPVHRVVAIKVIRRGMDTARIVQRFAIERQTLAMMSHPNIARLFDAGTTAAGRPFFVMELVDGAPVTRYADDHGLDLPARLALFADVCRGVRHAHQKGVIHRDLKPSNILVAEEEGRAVPKVIDFGVAKATHTSSAELSTGLRAIGTPCYMSPEQAGLSDAPVDTRSDIYALGVVLYQLVTGRPPWRFETGTPSEVYRTLRDSIAPHPSSVRPGTAGIRSRDLKGDLDSIILKAIEVDPDRRYGSVEQLADDLERYRIGRPVQARAGTRSYRIRKFVGRHRVASAAGLAFTITIGGFTVVTLQQSRTLAAERDAAFAAEARAGANAAFLATLFKTANPREAGTHNVTAHDMLRAGVAGLQADQDLDPRVRADLGLTLGLALVNLDELEPGIAAIERSLADSLQAYGRDSLETAERLHRLGDVLRQANRLDEAHALLTDALQIRRRHIRDDTYEIADSYNNLAILAAAMGRHVEADTLQARSIAIHERVSGPASPQVAVPLNNLALLKRRQGRLAEALALATRSYEILRTTDDQSSALRARQNLADIVKALGRVDEAETIYRELLDAGRSLLGLDHSTVINFESLIAQSRRDAGDYETADRMFAALEARIRRTLGDADMSVTILTRHRGLLDLARGDLDRAERRLRQALDRHLAALDRRHFRVPSFRRSLADALIALGRLDEAEAQLRMTLDLLPEASVYPHIERAETLVSLAWVLRMTGRSDELRDALGEAERVVRHTTGPDSPDMAAVRAVATVGVVQR